MMAAQSLREQKIRDRFASETRRADMFWSAVDQMLAPTPAQQWLANVKIPAADEGER